MIMRIPALQTLVHKAAQWDESKHPRADNGQFGSGSGTSRGGGSSKPKKPSKTKRKMERREEAASQARVGGAIQTLLSGGSALDKVAWFKQPEKPTKAPEKNPKARKPKRTPVPYGINPKHHPLSVLSTIDDRARLGDIGSTPVGRQSIRDAVQGIQWSLETGRLHGYADITLRHLKGGDMTRLVEEISSKQMSQNDVPRYLNNKYTAPEEPKAKKPAQKKPKAEGTAPRINSALVQSDIDRGLLNGVRSGSKSETKLKELSATGEISWDHEGNLWQSRRGGTTRRARDMLAAYSDYKPIGERLKEFESDYANLQRQAPGKEFPKAKEKLDRLRSEYESLYGKGPEKKPEPEKNPESKPTKPKEEAAPAKEPTPQTDIKVEDGELTGSKILSLGNKRAGVMQHADGSFVVLSQVDRKTVDRKEFKHLDVANRYAEAWLKGGRSGGGSTNGDAGQPGEVSRDANKLQNLKAAIIETDRQLNTIEERRKAARTSSERDKIENEWHERYQQRRALNKELDKTKKEMRAKGLL